MAAVHHPAFLLYIDTLYGVRPKKGERRFNGCLVKASVVAVESMDEAVAEIVEARANIEPGYCRVIGATLRAGDWGGKDGPPVAEWAGVDQIDALRAPKKAPAPAAPLPAPKPAPAQMELF